MRERHSTPIDYQPLTNPPSIFPSMALSQPPDYQHPFQNAPHLSSPTSANSQPAISPLFACQCVPLQLAAYVFATFRLLRRHSVTRSLRFRRFSLAQPNSHNSQPSFSSLLPFRTARRTLSPLFVRSAALRGRSAYVFALFCSFSRPIATRGLCFRRFSLDRGDLAGRCFCQPSPRPKAGRQAVRAEPWSAGADRVTRWTMQSSLPSRRKTFSGSPGR